MSEASSFRDAMSLLTTAVNVVTTAGDSGIHGFTASAVCSVSDDPPTVLVCMNRAARSHVHFVGNQTLCVNVLGTQHEPLSNVFASKLDSDARFEHGAWDTLVTGAPALEDALVNLDCEIESVQDVGTHSVFMCRVVAIRQSEQEESLVYFNRAYHHLRQSEPA